ncbi:hypothetical protein C173_02749 [Paenibacillus sp. FSL R7-277]|nr:hypothetical protein C173_02749 [Paenibacillus sp. FSL R7-277]
MVIGGLLQQIMSKGKPSDLKRHFLHGAKQKSPEAPVILLTFLSLINRLEKISSESTLKCLFTMLRMSYMIFATIIHQIIFNTSLANYLFRTKIPMVDQIGHHRDSCILFL